MRVYGYIVRWEPNSNTLRAPEQTGECDEKEVLRWEDFLGWNGEEGDNGCFEALVTVREDEVKGKREQSVVMKKGMEVIRKGVKKRMLQAVADTEGWCRRLERELEEERKRGKEK